MNKPYTCHVNGCAPCTFDAYPDDEKEAVEAMGMPAKKMQVKCYGAGSCHSTYKLDLTTDPPTLVV